MVAAAVDRAFREHWGRVLASLIGFLGDFDVAEEAAQEAFAIAAERWPRTGIPANPAGWLVVTARHRAIDRLRRERVGAEKLRQLDPPADTEETVDETTTFPDERLELIFTCCHPALAVESQVALTLRSLGGLTTEEIARAFQARIHSSANFAGSIPHRMSISPPLVRPGEDNPPKEDRCSTCS